MLFNKASGFPQKIKIKIKKQSQWLGCGGGRAVEEKEREACKKKERKTCSGERKSQTDDFFWV